MWIEGFPRSKTMYIEFGAIIACPSLTGATPFNKSPVESCGFVEGCGAWGETARKKRTKLNLPSWGFCLERIFMHKIFWYLRVYKNLIRI